MGTRLSIEEFAKRREGGPATAGATTFLTVRELAALLRISPQTIYNNIGRLDKADGVHRPSSRCTRIERDVFLQRFRAGLIKFR
jgi:hypothetical protein